MHDSLIQIVFYVVALLAVASAFMVITQNNPVRCVLFLVLTFFASSILWMLAEAEFLALILVLVYVGAVMTLFLFVVMMLNVDIESMKSHFKRYLPFGLIFIALLTALLMTSLPVNPFKSYVEAKPQVTNSQTPVSQDQPKLVQQQVVVSNTEALGLVLYTDYFLAFELAAIILLVAIISAITLVHRGTVRCKRQDIRQQIMTNRNDRVQLISMKSEK